MALTTTDFKRPTAIRLVRAAKRLTLAGVNGICCVWEVDMEDGKTVIVLDVLESSDLRELGSKDAVADLAVLAAALPDYTEEQLAAMLESVPNLDELKKSVAYAAYVRGIDKED